MSRSNNLEQVIPFIGNSIRVSENVNYEFDKIPTGILRSVSSKLNLDNALSKVISEFGALAKYVSARGITANDKDIAFKIGQEDGAFGVFAPKYDNVEQRIKTFKGEVKNRDEKNSLLNYQYTSDDNFDIKHLKNGLRRLK